MSLYNFLYNLQRKSHKSKKRVLTGLLAISFFLLALFWILMFKNQVSQEKNLTTSLDLKEAVVSDLKMQGPVAALAEGFNGLKSDIVRKIGEYKNKDILETAGKRPVYQLPVN